jgi:heat shock protein HtpX
MRGYLRTFVLFLVFTLLLVAIGQVAGMYWGTSPRTSLLIFLVPALLLNFAMYFFSAKMVLWSSGARMVTPEEAPRLHRLVERVALRAGIPKPRVAVIPTATPNAFATGRNPKHAVVAATFGILEILDDDELEGVLAHEVSHVKNRDILIMTIASAFASVVSYAAWAMLWNRDRNANPLVGLLVWLLAPIAATLVQLAISRSREFGADASGAQLLGNPRPLANALLKLERGVQARPMRHGNPATSSLYIVNPFRGARLSRMFSTHPSTEERVRRLEELSF